MFTRFLCAALLCGSAASAEVVTYKATFQEIIWGSGNVPEDFLGHMSLTWTFDTDAPERDRLTSASLRAFKGGDQPLGNFEPFCDGIVDPTPYNAMCVDAVVEDIGPAGALGDTYLFDGAFGSFGTFSDPPTAEELSEAGVFLGGTIFITFKGPVDFDSDVFLAGSRWVTTAPVPLPASAWLLLAGLGGLAAFRCRRKPGSA